MRIACPSCGGRNLRGQRDEEAEVVHVVCKDCDHAWTRDPWKCPTCGGQLYAVRRALLEKARGTQQSIIGYNTVRLCPKCDPPEDRDEGWMSRRSTARSRRPPGRSSAGA